MNSRLSTSVFRATLAALTLSLLVPASPCHADLTLVYGSGTVDAEPGRPTHQVHVSEGKVSIANTRNRRLLIYDTSSNRAVVVDHQAKQVIPLQRKEVEKMAEIYLETQRQVLADLERKIKDLPAKEQAALRSMMDVLHAGIEISVSETVSEGELADLERQEAVAGIEATVAEIRRGEEETPVETVWVVDSSRGRWSPSDLETLRGLDRYFADLNRGLPAGLRKELGELRFLDRRGRLILKRESRQDTDESGALLEVRRLDLDPIEKGWFEIPADFADSTLLGPPETGPEKPSDP